MSETVTLRQEEKVLAGLAHGSILLGLFSNGIGGIVAALVIWASQREKSAYAASQALQALVYQGMTFVITMVAWCCWGVLWMILLLPPLIADPERYANAVPPGMWLGLSLIAAPLAIWGLTIVYGLWAAARCLGGHEFRYAVIGRWLENQAGA
jgi:uncharacterized Tic20 family protein